MPDWRAALIGFLKSKFLRWKEIIYNSKDKVNIWNMGERFVPLNNLLNDEVAFEHFHRYHACTWFIKG